ncbi:RNA 2'-phosphotransferase [Kineosporia succinea]|uniref:Probable RNA 2'-phosphotransferase n=1 Tax=Kineosporia succinea TaxID=84632 RepID=A0ABT9PAT6_9ACTN|nr:RNA 2'-phosphotransferase [Kineosporia succinea]MDP9829160.1 putative RNA 2'-phosphotransferase [Kineosporia succinea]
MSRASRYLSLLLRHHPERAGLTPDPAGWVPVDDLLAAVGIDRPELESLVRDDDKQRFQLRGNRIRAAQGHSIDVDLGLEQREPPETLYHGTYLDVVPSVRTQGLLPMTRRLVHLSPDAQTARRVGARRGEPVVLTVAARRAFAEGRPYYRAANGVWLTDHVPPHLLDHPPRGGRP